MFWGAPVCPLYFPRGIRRIFGLRPGPGWVTTLLTTHKLTKYAARIPDPRFLCFPTQAAEPVVSATVTALATATATATALLPTATAISSSGGGAAVTGGEGLLLCACVFFSLGTVRLGMYAPRMDSLQLACVKKLTLASASLSWAAWNQQGGQAVAVLTVQFLALVLMLSNCLTVCQNVTKIRAGKVETEINILKHPLFSFEMQRRAHWLQL